MTSVPVSDSAKRPLPDAILQPSARTEVKISSVLLLFSLPFPLLPPPLHLIFILTSVEEIRRCFANQSQFQTLPNIDSPRTQICLAQLNSHVPPQSGKTFREPVSYRTSTAALHNFGLRVKDRKNKLWNFPANPKKDAEARHV